MPQIELLFPYENKAYTKVLTNQSLKHFIKNNFTDYEKYILSVFNVDQKTIHN